MAALASRSGGAVGPSHGARQSVRKVFITEHKATCTLPEHRRHTCGAASPLPARRKGFQMAPVTRARPRDAAIAKPKPALVVRQGHDRPYIMIDGRLCADSKHVTPWYSHHHAAPPHASNSARLHDDWAFCGPSKSLSTLRATDSPATAVGARLASRAHTCNYASRPGIASQKKQKC